MSHAQSQAGALVPPVERPLRVAWLYPRPKRHFLEAYRRGEEPDQLSAIDTVRDFGMVPTLVDPLPRPWNPFAGRHSLWSGIDPLRAVRLVLSRRHYDLFLSVGESSALILLLLRSAFRFRQPVVVWDPALGGNWTPRRKILDYVLSRADRILVVGENQCAHVRAHYPRAAPVAAIHHWEDTRFYAPESSASADRGYVLSIGDDVARDFRCLAQAAAEVAAPVIIKSGRAPDFPLPPNVQVMSKRVPYRELRDLYAGARLVVVPLTDAVHASGVNSILEAFAMGKATVVSDSEGIRDFVQDGETALVVPPGNPDAMRLAINRLLVDRGLADRLGRNARRVAEERFALRAFASRLAAQLRTAYETRSRTFKET
jgi:glycosyltransferase involved in cell wall biosynthesis